MKLINLVPFKEAANAAQQAAIAINMKKKGIKPKDEAKGPCWQGYKQVGMKGKGGKQVPNCVPISESEINETTGREAKEIAKLTGTRDSMVQKFIDDFNLNAKNLFNFIAKGKEKVRKDFATAMSGRPGNKYQGDFVGMFGESEVSATGQPGGYFKEETCPDCGKKMEQCECGMYEGNDDDYDELDVEPEEIDDFIDFLKAYKNTLDEGGCPCLYEAEYQGRDVKLGHPMQGDVKKFKVYVKNPAGNVVKVNFGQKGMKIRKSNPAARKSFRARMNCDNPGPRTKANYWSCRKW